MRLRLSLSNSRSFRLRAALCLAAVGLLTLTGISAVSSAPLIASDTNAEPVNFTAKTLSHDDEKQTVTATGDVELVQGDRILRADKMVYYLSEDRVTAIGNVSLLDERGDVSFAEYVELRNKMKDGFIQGLLSLLADGSRFTAAEAKRDNNGTKTTLTDASYTVCKVCEADPHPLWQIKAKQVTHDSRDQTVKYKHARLEFEGVPVFYSPIFSHPDPTLKRKSGFMRPEYGWSKQLGTHVEGGYYYDIAPDKDMTLAVEPTTLAGTLLKGQWRERFENGSLKIDATTANSDRKEEDGRVETNRQRGNIFADGRFDLDEKWRSGFDLARTTDKEYLRLYDISKENVLTSQVYAERFSGRDYSRVSAFDFQDVRLGVRPDQPAILPLAEHEMIGEPNSLWGGRWQMDTSLLDLLRSGNEQDVQRGSLGLGWQRHGISSGGFENTLALESRGDLYGVQHSDAAKLNPALEDSPNISRGIVRASFVSGYPLAKTLPGAQAVIEPVAGVSLSPKLNNGQQIPNEDSVDVQFDADNLFQQNRYPGLDREEDGGRFNYGVKTGIYGDDGRYGKFFLGESYRFYGDKLFPNGSGLETKRSDFVGQI
jgi:LPS-assembly protein